MIIEWIENWVFKKEEIALHDRNFQVTTFKAHGCLFIFLDCLSHLPLDISIEYWCHRALWLRNSAVFSTNWRALCCYRATRPTWSKSHYKRDDISHWQRKELTKMRSGQIYELCNSIKQADTLIIAERVEKETTLKNRTTLNDKTRFRDSYLVSGISTGGFTWDSVLSRKLYT